MFRNSPEMGGGGIVCLGPTAMIVRTIYMSESSSGASLDDLWVFAGPVSCPPIRGVVHSLDGRRNVRSFFFFVALGTLFCIYVFWRRGTRGSHVFDSDWARGLVSGGSFSVSRIFQGKKGEFL